MITLKRITIDDLEWARRLRNTNRQYFFNDKHISSKEHIEWFNKLDSNFFIIYKDKQKVGTISEKNGELGNIIIDEAFRGQEILKQVISLIGGFSLAVKSDNTQAIKAYEKCGFKIIGYIMKK